MTPTEMELRDQLEDLGNQLADQDVMLRERDAEVRELTEQNDLLRNVLTNVIEERAMLAARVKELETAGREVLDCLVLHNLVDMDAPVIQKFRGIVGQQ